MIPTSPYYTMTINQGNFLRRLLRNLVLTLPVLKLAPLLEPPSMLNSGRPSDSCRTFCSKKQWQWSRRACFHTCCWRSFCSSHGMRGKQIPLIAAFRTDLLRISQNNYIKSSQRVKERHDFLGTFAAFQVSNHDGISFGSTFLLLKIQELFSEYIISAWQLAFDDIHPFTGTTEDPFPVIVEIYALMIPSYVPAIQGAGLQIFETDWRSVQILE